jgi:heat shock protein HtpX
VIDSAELSPPRTKVFVAAALVPTICLGLVVTALLVVVLGPLGLVPGLLGTSVACFLRAKSFWAGIEAEVLGSLGAVSAEGDAHARLLNLAEGLSATCGVPIPGLFVMQDPAANMMVIGSTPELSTIVVTSGLLDALDRIQLEGVVGRAFAQMRQGDLPAATLAVRAANSPLVRSLAGAGFTTLASPERDILLDRAGVGLTRYPPGLLAALVECERVGTSLANPDRATAHLWMADPGPEGAHDGERAAFELRLEGLRLL